MILYTPMQLELVLEGLDNTKYPDYKEIQYKGVPMLVEGAGFGKQRIVKLLSTDPFDYLKPEMAPGSIIET
ncbi:MAG: YlzJ-like family protein [Desulfotomaculaceae bacterium]|nr:YlzJ-like family protein [Desulfotomaculaceae bacterium]MDD4765973.1 YlzJ-like family protein [Desulfotomaculaceae bacterium]